MTDTNQSQSKQLLLTGLLLLLVVVVGIQAWYMVGMKKQLDDLNDQQSSTQVTAQNTSDSTSTSHQAVQRNADILPLKPPPPATSRQAPPKAIQPPHSLFDDDFFNNQAYDAQNWNPYEEIQRMQRDMDRLFNNTFSRFNNSPDFQHLFRQGVTTPEMDIQEEDDQYIVILNLPGSSEKNVSVNLQGQTLTVSGKQNFEKQNKDNMGNIIFQERRSGSFQRSITLPGPVKQAGMKTEIDNGVLRITIPRDV